MNKDSSGKNLYRSLVSIDIVAIARSVLMISRDDSDPYTRCVFPVKSSLAPEGEGIGFRIGGVEGFKWLGKCTYSKDVVETGYSMTGSKLLLAKRYLEELLCEGDLPSREIMTRLAELGISERTVNKARKEMDIKGYKEKSGWFWHLKSLLPIPIGE